MRRRGAMGNNSSTETMRNGFGLTVCSFAAINCVRRWCWLSLECLTHMASILALHALLRGLINFDTSTGASAIPTSNWR